MRRNPEQLADVTFMPLVLTLLFGFMFGGAVAGGMVSYLPTLIPGSSLQRRHCLRCCWAQLREDMDKGVFDRFGHSPSRGSRPLQAR